MRQLTFNVPDTTPEALHVPAERLGAERLLAVAGVLEAGRRLGARVPEIPAFPWIEIRWPPEPIPAFPRFIHRGEAEVLALARAADAPLVIIDDLMARGGVRAYFAAPPMNDHTDARLLRLPC